MSATVPDSGARMGAKTNADVKRRAAIDRKALDGLTRLTSDVLQVPIALVSLMRDGRQQIASQSGLDPDDLPRNLTFCSHATLGRDFFEVPDTLQDGRFADHPLVADSPFVRYYGAIPLATAGGEIIGTLSVIDAKPRQFSSIETDRLRIIADQVLASLASNAGNGRHMRDTDGAQEAREFVYVVCHDFRAPLVNVLGFSDELKHSTQELRDWLRQQPSLPDGFLAEIEGMLDERFAPALEFIRDSAAQMSAQVQALNELAREERRELQDEVVDLAALIQTIVGTHELELQDAGAVVDVAPLATLRADATVLHHIFQNLIDNAVKYRSQERPLRIAVSMDLSEQGIVVHVRDNGRGIASADQARIFDMFVRTGTKGVRGEGVGLYHARTLVAKLGGRIWCDSALGDGATFHVALPLEPIRPPVPSGSQTHTRACSG